MVADIVLLIQHAAAVVTPGMVGPLSGKQQGTLAIIPDGAIACAAGRIVAVGPTDEVRAAVAVGPGTRILDATGCVVTPGLVDAHTHVVYAGERVAEFELRAAGATYAEILAAGGGIHRTVQATRQASLSDLVVQTSRRLDRMLGSGTTTAEAKSGYGLDCETELKQLAIMADDLANHPLELVPTYLGAHAVPPGQDADSYIQLIVDTMLPAVAAQGIARFCDIFCEVGVFSREQSERLLRAGLAYGLRPKIHADEFANTGGALLAAQLGAISADHLHHAHDDGLRALAVSGTVAVLLPGTNAFLGLTEQAPARRMVELGVPVALGTDFNPGSCPSASLALMMSLAVCQLRLSPAEALVAATANAAAACGLGDRLGRLAPGYQADMVLWEGTDYREIAYYIGANLARVVIKKGQVVAPP
ncbi:MAG: imidazolonepropionase [Cyanobacteria bacterium NC_groundwater_1444_Ag_S-0.65um_54_12]|nr:imidazolonepropionase [Cyanobacteria bacterium NC_groundwater_1444_Ag_S-0.65um_54_12]